MAQRVAIVTGAASGIGRATPELLVAQELAVAAFDRVGDGLQVGVADAASVMSGQWAWQGLARDREPCRCRTRTWTRRADHRGREARRVASDTDVGAVGEAADN